MSTKYAVLGLLLERRGYGYQLVQRLTERLGPAWQLTPSSVYAALDLLEGEGLVRRAESSLGAEPAGETEPAPRGPRRVVYEATAAGCEAFSTWVSCPSTRQEPIRRELHLKVALARPTDAPKLLAALEHEELLVRRQREESAEVGEGQASDSAWATSAAALARAGAIARLGGELRWIDAARSVLESLAAGKRATGKEMLRDL